ncbi:MAG: adenylyl-sulfate kinase [Bryobacteraceae bacterium]
MLPVIWFTGLSGAGKSTLCRAVESELQLCRIPTSVLDGDIIRQSLSKDLGYSPEDRVENLRRVSRLAKQVNQDGFLVLIAAISPYETTRAEIRKEHACFLEVFVNAPLEICESRDPKGLYRQARAGLIAHFTGISAPYEIPSNPDIECKTSQETIQVSCGKVLAAIEPFVSDLAARDIRAFQRALNKSRIASNVETGAFKP